MPPGMVSGTSGALQTLRIDDFKALGAPETTHQHFDKTLTLFKELLNNLMDALWPPGALQTLNINDFSAPGGGFWGPRGPPDPQHR